MTEFVPLPIRSLPGIKRDGTQLEGEYYVDGQWCRFNRGKPRKMNGYRSLSDQVKATVRGMHSLSKNGYTYVHFGNSNIIEQLTIQNSTLLASGSLFDRTPAGFVTSANNTWQMDALYNSTSTSVSLLAHASPNLSDIDNTTLTDVYYGDVTSGAALATIGHSTCGGIVVLHPYLFLYCTDGLIRWSPANDPLNPTYSEARISSTKIVKGLPLRAGPGQSPAGLFWSLDSLIRCVFVGGAPVFSFDTIGSTTVMSPHAIIEHDGVYYWPGKDRFFTFNGVMQELPNDLNRNWFFDNIERSNTQKVFAMKVPKWGEIWWCFPYGNSSECTHAIIYNIRLKTWYDTVLPTSGRSFATYASVLSRPLMASVSQTAGKVKLWMHEEGFDEVDGTTVNPINSWFETSDVTLMQGDNGNGGKLNSLYCNVIEPDFDQTGEMYAFATGRINARSVQIQGELKTFPEVPAATTDQVLKINETYRQFRFRFGSNVQGGYYEMGDIYGHFKPAGSRYTGGA